jgi:hypothetical protein
MKIYFYVRIAGEEKQKEVKQVDESSMMISCFRKIVLKL